MRAWANRLASVVLAAGGLCAGLALGGSVGVTGCCFCDAPEPVELGTYDVQDSPDRTELEGAVVEVAEGQVEIAFTDLDGADWLIVYRVVDKPYN